MAEFRKLTYEALHVGEEFVSNDHLVTPAGIDAYGFAGDDHHPWFFGDSRSGPSPIRPCSPCRSTASSRPPNSPAS